MWQAQSFNAAQIDKELGWAESLGMNTMRVFLHDLVWQEDPEGFKKRIDQFLEISSRHHIKRFLYCSIRAVARIRNSECSIRPSLEFTTQDGCRLRGARHSAILCRKAG